MTELGSINKLLKQRKEDFLTITRKAGEVYGEKLTKVFSILYNKPDIEIKWNSIELMGNSEKIVSVTGIFALELGSKVNIGGEDIIIDEENRKRYSNLAQFSFPINMLELATVEELVSFINKIAQSGSDKKISPEDLKVILEKEYDAYDEALLADPEKLESLTKPTRPKEIHGFSTEGLSEEQFRQLSWYNPDNETSLLN